MPEEHDDSNPLTIALDKEYRFPGYGDMKLGKFLAERDLVYRNKHLRLRGRRREKGKYVDLGRCCTEYSLWWAEADGPHGLDVPKIVYDDFEGYVPDWR